MIIVDTTVWIDYLSGRDNRETDYLDRELSRQHAHRHRQNSATIRL